jgi:hypothetical protein
MQACTADYALFCYTETAVSHLTGRRPDTVMFKPLVLLMNNFYLSSCAYIWI